MEIEFSGKLEKSDAGKFMDLVDHPIPGKGKLTFPLWRGLVIAGIALGLVGIPLLIRDPYIGVICLALAVVFCFGSLNGRRNLVRQIGANFEKAPPITGKITAEGVRVKSQFVDNSINWKAYTGYGDSGDFYALFENNVMVLGLKRSYFATEVDWKSAMEIVARNVPRIYGKTRDSSKINWRDLIPIIILVIFAIVILVVEYRLP